MIVSKEMLCLTATITNKLTKILYKNGTAMVVHWIKHYTHSQQVKDYGMETIIFSRLTLVHSKKNRNRTYLVWVCKLKASYLGLKVYLEKIHLQNNSPL